MDVSGNAMLRGAAVAAAFALTAAAAQAEGLGIGRTESGGLGIGVSAGGVKAGVSLGGSSVASAKASVGGGVKAGATVGGGAVASAGAKVGSSVSAGAKVGGSGNLANVTASVGTTGTGVCVGANCGAGTTPGTNPPGTTTPPVTGVTPGTPVPGGLPPKAPKVLACASADGNTTAFNGYPLTDRQGRVLGVIHSVQLSNGTQIHAVSVRGVGRGCTTLKEGGFTVAGYAVRGSFDAQKMGLAYQ